MGRGTIIIFVAIIVVLGGVAVWQIAGPRTDPVLSTEGLRVGIGAPTVRIPTTIEPTLAAAGLPANAEPLLPGDYGIDESAEAIRGVWPARGVTCDAGEILRVATDRGTILASLVAGAGFPCALVLAQWQQAAPTAAHVGVRYVPEGEGIQRLLVIVSGEGTTMGVRVGGVWRVP